MSTEPISKCLVLLENKAAEEIRLEICQAVFKYLEISNPISIIDPCCLNLDWGEYLKVDLDPVNIDTSLVPYYWIKSLTPWVNAAVAIGEFKLSLNKTTPLSLLDQLCKIHNIPLFIVKIK